MAGAYSSGRPAQLQYNRIKVHWGIEYNLQNKNFLQFLFLNVPVFTVARRSAGRLFRALGAAMLNARSPNL